MAIAAAAAVSAAASAAAAAAIAGTTISAMTLFTYAVVAAGMSVVSRALAPSPSLGAQMRGLTQTRREPAGTRSIVYGQMRIGGNVVFIDNSGADNKYLHLVIAFASHEIESFEEFYFNDKKVWDGGSFEDDWGTYVTVVTKSGTDTQSADSTLVSASTPWTDDHKLLGIAYAHFRLEWDADKFTQGIPNITAVIKGKKVYDPRKDSTSSVYDSSLGVSTHRSDQSSTWEYSTNPALCIRDYLVDTKYGLGEDVSLIDLDSLHLAADLCDEQVSLSGSGTQDRYQANGVVDTANAIKDNIEQLLSAMGGRLTYSGGKYFIDGADYKTPTVTFTEADCISDIQTQTAQSRRTLYNTVKGIFVSEEKNYKVMDYPAQTLKTEAGNFVTGTKYRILFVGTTDFTAIGAAANDVGVEFTATGAGTGTGTASKSIVEDGARVNLDMPLPFVTNNTQAQRLAKIALLKSRQQVVINMAVNLKGLQVKVGDTIKVTNERLGYSEKVFDVIDYGLAINGDGSLGVNLQCIETAAAVYDWTTDDEEDFLSGGEVTLYDGRTVADVTNFTLTEDSLIGVDGTLKSAVILDWTAPTDAFIDFYKIRYNENGTTTYFHVETKETNLTIPNLDRSGGKTYDFRIQVQNLLGVSSSGVTLTDQALQGDTTAPDPVTNVNVETGLKYTATVTWTNPTNADLAYVQIYTDSSGLTKPASPIAKVNGTEYVYVPRSKAEYSTRRYFWLEAVDFSGNVSTTVGPVNEVIILPKADEIDGDVGEALTFGLYNSSTTTLGTSDVTFGEFEVPAPDQDITKFGTLLAHGSIQTTSSTASFTVKITVERKSKGATSGNLIGTIVASGSIAAGAAYADIAGNHMKEIDLFGGIATSQTSPSAVYNVSSVEYDQTNDRTRIVYAKFGAITSGDLYYNADRWTSSGTWLTYSAQEARYPFPDYSGVMAFMLFQPLAKSDASETYRIRARHYGFTGTSVVMAQGLVGQIQLLS